MATIAGAQILTLGGRRVLDRVQSAGPSDLTINREKIYELGNDSSLDTIPGIPEVSFNVESFDVSTEFECELINVDPTTFPNTPGSNEIDFKDAVPIDMASLFKTKKKSNVIASGVIAPFLTLSSVSYRFGVGESASQSFTLNGDTQLLVPGQPYVEHFVNSGVGPYTIARTADIYNGEGYPIYILSVSMYNTTDGTFKRLYFDNTGDAGYTNTATSFTLPNDPLLAAYDQIKVTYSSQTKVDYDEDGVGPNGQIVHEGIHIKPAAVRSQHLDVFIGTGGATPTFTRFNSVQNIEANWSVSLENGEELGNSQYTYSEYDVPEVSGSIGIRAMSPEELALKLSQITGVPANEVIGPNSSVPVPLEMRVYNPLNKSQILKTIYIPDARFDLPGFTGQVQSRLENTMNWNSDSGEMYVYNGARLP